MSVTDESGLCAGYFDWAPEAVALLHPTTLVILATNAAFEASLAPSTTVKGLPFLNTVIRAIDSTRMATAIQSANEGLAPVVYGVETLVLDAAQSFPKWLRFDWMLKRHKDVLVASARQVTIAKDREKEAEHEYDDFFNKAPIALHWLSGTGHVLWANETEMNLLGYTAQEYIGQPIMKFCPDEEELVLDIFKQLGSGNTVRDVPVRFRTKGGDIKHLLIDSNVNWNEDGSFKHTRCFIRDDTGRKVQEAREQAAAKAQAEMHRQKDAFMQRIFYEIRTPCHALRATTQRLLQSTRDPSVRQQLEGAWAQSLLITKLADDVKCAMLLQEGQAPMLKEQWFQLLALTAEIKSLVHNLFPKPDVRFDVTVEGPGKPEDVMLLTDMDLLGSILRHLLSNAMRVTETGFVHLAVKVGEKGPNSPKQAVGFTVTNTGPPVDVDNVDRVCQRYWLDADLLTEEGNSDHNDRAGTFGLGLYVSFNFVQLLGGDLQVESSAAATTFFFTLHAETKAEGNWDDDDDATYNAEESFDMELPTPQNSHDHLTGIKKAPKKPKKKGSIWHCLVPWASKVKPTSQPCEEPSAWSCVANAPAAQQHFKMETGSSGGPAPFNPLGAVSLATRRCSILVVDHNTICQKVVGKCLEALDISFGVANNGKIACGILEADPSLYDLILMDVRMPIMDGIAATRHIRGTLHLTTPVVMFTADITPETRADALRAGATDFLQKPATLQTLTALLRRLQLC